MMKLDKLKVDATFATLTNVNFDPDRFVDYLKRHRK